MYHELILALQGFTGDLFFQEGDQIKIRDDFRVPFMHPSEVSVIEEILVVASYYSQIQKKIGKQFDSQLYGTELGEVSSEGIYMSALCNGIENVLDMYCEKIVDLESTILNNIYISLTYIREQVEEYKRIFRVLLDLLDKAKRSRSSVTIVEVLKEFYDSNIELREILAVLIPHVNKILFTQIKKWVVFGKLSDPMDEFFIQIKADIDSQQPRKQESNKFSSPEVYIVNYSLVPSHFPVSFTEKILFIGNSIRILRSMSCSENSILEKQNLMYEKMDNLPLNTFRLDALLAVTEELSESVGKHLHHLVVTETDLLKYLNIFKDIYLTGRGELFHSWLLRIRHLSMVFRMSSGQVEGKLREEFSISADKVQVQEEVLQRINLSCCKTGESFQLKSVHELLSNLSVQIEVQWPLQILFTDQSIEQYNTILRYLLQLRLIQLQLNIIWMNTRKVFRFPIPRGPAQLRTVMSYFIDHLQHYLHEDVLETQYVVLMDAVNKSTNFEQIRVSHAEFLSNIMSQSFIKHKKIRHFFSKMMNVCNDFIEFMNEHINLCENKGIPIDEGITDTINAFRTDFRRHTDLLLNFLRSLSNSPQSNQGLTQKFLLRLDYNSYFSSNGILNHD